MKKQPKKKATTRAQKKKAEQATNAKRQVTRSTMPPYRIRSTSQGVIWPAIPARGAQCVHTLVLQLEQSQWLSAEEIERRQMIQLGNLLEFAQSRVPFYADRLRPVVERISSEPLTAEVFAEIPILTRQDIQSQPRDLLPKDFLKTHGKVSKTQTSGSTGKPIQVFHSQLFHLMWQAVTIRNHLWHRRDFEGTLAMVRGVSAGADYPEGTTAKNWGIPGEVGIETGPLICLDINCSPEQQLDWLQRKAPAYFISHPTNLERLARHALKHRIKLPSLRETLTVAEILTPEIRELVRKALGRESGRHVYVARPGLHGLAVSGTRALPHPGRNLPGRGSRRRWKTLPTGHRRADRRDTASGVHDALDPL